MQSNADTVSLLSSELSAVKDKASITDRLLDAERQRVVLWRKISLLLFGACFAVVAFLLLSLHDPRTQSFPTSSDSRCVSMDTFVTIRKENAALRSVIEKCRSNNSFVTARDGPNADAVETH